MFESEMENLGLGLSLGSSDLLFPDDLLNAPLNIDDVFAIGNDNANANAEDDKDLLAKVIDEIKMDSAAMADDVPFNTSSLNANTVLFEDVGSPQAAALDAKAYSVLEDTFMGDESYDNDGGPSDSENTSDLIQEMEQFLVQHEQPEPMSLDSTISEQESTNSNGLLSVEDSADAKTILAALMKGDIRVDDEDNEDNSQRQKELGINNISQVITEDRQKIVIVIANDDHINNNINTASNNASQMVPVASPSYSNSGSDAWSPQAASAAASEASDSDWSPNSPAVAAKKTKAKSAGNAKKTVGKRGPYKRSSAYNVKDKKERKKLQNVVAARRYRDKKKSEQQTIEEEEQELTNKNQELVNKAGEIEGELKTLKKLMMELGLIKVSAATAKTLA